MQTKLAGAFSPLGSPGAAPPLQNGRFRLEARLGEGADASVWAAVDARDGARVALKVLRRSGEPSARERLRWEFAALAALDHPNLVRVFDLEIAQPGGPLEAGQLFFTTELLDGTPPREHLSRLAPPARARALCQLLAEVASALEALHRRGLIHHDVKPDNLLVDGAGRVRLTDLGLGAARGLQGGLRGTPRYLAPEAFAGAVADPRGDLFALGATAVELWTGRPPRAGATLGEIAKEAVTRPLERLDGGAPSAPRELARLVAKLAAPDPADRPSSARAVVEAALALGARLDGALLATPEPPPLGRPRLSGRAQELETALGALGTARILLIEGAPGSGRSRLVEELRRAAQLAATAAGGRSRSWHGPSVELALRTLDPDRPEAPLLGEHAGRARLGRLCALLAETPSVLHLDLGERVDPFERELLALAANGAAQPSVVVAEVPTGLALAGEGVARLPLGPLDRGAIVALAASMLGSADDALGQAIHRASGGEPRRAVALLRAARAHAPPTRRVTAADVAAVGEEAGAEIGALVLAALIRLNVPARRLVESLAVLDRAASLTELGALADLDAAGSFGALAEAALAGVIEAEPAGYARFPSRAHAAAAYAAASPSRRRALHQRALAAADSDDDRARHLVLLGPPEAAARAALKAGESALGRLELDRAERRLADAVRFGAAGLGSRARLRLAETRILRADYSGAERALAPIAEDPSAALLRARALQRAGDHPAAEARLRALLAAGSAVPAAAQAEARGLLGRVLLARGAYAEVVEVCAAEPALGDAPGLEPLLEARGLALLYLGRLDEAGHAFNTLKERLAGEAAPLALARARSLAGMVAQARDDLAEAAAAFEAALALARKGCDLHGAAIYAANLGATLREQAEYARALAPTEEAVRDLGRIGKRVEQAGALFNYGNLLLSVGDLDGAERAAELALTLASAERAPREAGYATLLRGDIARRGGDPAEAVTHYRRALATFGADAVRERVIAGRALAETLVEKNEPAPARAQLAETIAVARAANLVDMVAATAVRIALALGEPPAAAELAALASARDHAERTHRRDPAFRAGLLLARAAVRAGDGVSAREHLTRAEQSCKEIVMRTPELRREAAAEDPDARRLRELLAAGEPTSEPPRSSARAVASPASPASPSSAASSDPLRRLLALNKRLNSELRLERLLELILDTVIELTSAERGFILLGDGAGPLQVSIARNMDQQALGANSAGAPAQPGGEAASFSRSIAERAAREATPIVTLDAAGDQRFEAALSVSDLKLRSVLAVPLSVKGRVVGCVYADHRLRAGAFGDADVALVCDLAEQAAIAIENARLLAENERRRHEVVALNRELERQVASQAVELGELHKEVRSSRAALSVRYDYDNLVGKTPRMLELFRLLDRVTDTALPVVIYGESGTGKELVARAIHHNGPRRSKPFVSESCAAIPETLLEAALFGHVRGAFTGADAERRGLFEVASGGTLFLDEVGEMPPSMQAKLLRVLTTGELRRVGGERSIRVDVRVLVASNRDLSRLVEEGKFREDLFYRLNVVRVALPPLRERSGDIPLLIEHFLRKHAESSGQPIRRVSRAALQKLTGYRWPGNVRELENEVIRAASLGGEILGEADLSPQVAAGEPEAAFESPDDLGLKRRVERLERMLLREALDRAGGNQSQAARLLGLSRFGLQKKLQRYHLA
ncbi:MAG TPA: sigma 54-interacting transcriptional regulator [Polyangia bacterium]